MSASPLMRHLVNGHAALIAELEAMGEAAPAELASVDTLLPPVAQDVIDRLSRHVATLRDAHRKPADPGPFDYPNPIAAARAWLIDTPRPSADNVARLMNELRLHMQKCGFVPTSAAYSYSAKRTEFAAWLAEQVAP